MLQHCVHLQVAHWRVHVVVDSAQLLLSVQLHGNHKQSLAQSLQHDQQAHESNMHVCIQSTSAGALQDVLGVATHICSQQSATAHWTLLQTSSLRTCTSAFCHTMLLTLTAVHLHLEETTAAGEDALVSLLHANGITASKQKTVQHELLRPKRKSKRKGDKMKRKKRHKSKHHKDESEGSGSDHSLDDLDLGIMSDNDAPDHQPGNTVWRVKTQDYISMLVPAESLPDVLLCLVLQSWLTAAS